MKVTVAGTEVLLTRHARARFLQRAGQVLTSEVLKQGAGITRQKPAWHFPTDDLSHRLLTWGYLVLEPADGGQYAFPLQLFEGDLLATTCLCRDRYGEAVAA